MEADRRLAKSFERWWPAKDAQMIAELWASCLTRTRSPDWWDQYKGRPDHVGKLIAEGEAVLLNWKSSS
ncbi:hypothetical protein AU476_19285 [Cupriavidus sp. UYMSc13B]|nr:hypothetical protein AU476_19285 [Cupriavidus sp. UYMSc13B]